MYALVLYLSSIINDNNTRLMGLTTELAERNGEHIQMTESLSQLDNVSYSASDHLKRAIRTQRESMARAAQAITNRINNLQTLIGKIEANNKMLEQRKNQLMQS